MKLIAHYPQQSLWMLMAVSKVCGRPFVEATSFKLHVFMIAMYCFQSTHSDRQQRCQRILNEAKSGNVPLAKLITVSIPMLPKQLTI